MCIQCNLENAYNAVPSGPCQWHLTTITNPDIETITIACWLPATGQFVERSVGSRRKAERAMFNTGGAGPAPPATPAPGVAAAQTPAAAKRKRRASVDDE